MALTPATLVVLLALLAAGPSPEDLRGAVRRELDTGDYQTELNEGPVDPDLPWRFVPPAWASRILGITLYVLLGVGVAFLLVILFREFGVGGFGGRRRVRDGTVVEGGARVDAVEPDRPPPDPDALAREGRYAEAVHALLLRALRRIIEGAAARYPPALTSREIARRTELDGPAGEALHQLVAAVEVSLFGGAPVTREDYEVCRGHRDRIFAGAGGGGR